MQAGPGWAVFHPKAIPALDAPAKLIERSNSTPSLHSLLYDTMAYGSELGNHRFRLPRQFAFEVWLFHFSVSSYVLERYPSFDPTNSCAFFLTDLGSLIGIVEVLSCFCFS